MPSEFNEETQETEEDLRTTLAQALEDDISTTDESDIAPEGDESADPTEAPPSAVEGSTEDEVTTERDPVLEAEASTGEDLSSDKAPASWTPAAREGWAELPQSARDFINKREHEITEALSQSGQARQFQQQFTDATNPFNNIFQAQGVDAMQGVQGVLQTAAVMYSGTPQQKAQQVADMMKDFSVDVGMLDSLLVGQPIEAPLAPGMEKMQAQLDSQNEYIQRQMHNEQQSYNDRRATIENEVRAFEADPANEFAVDLRPAMAGFIQMAIQQGQPPMSKEDAYKHALQMRPDLLQIQANRKGNTQANNALTSATKASVSLAQSSGITQTPDNSQENLRETLARQLQGR